MAYKQEWWERFLKPLKTLAGNENASFDDTEYARVPVSRKVTDADILSYYGCLRQYGEHEDTLINSRLTWSLSIHAFLLTTYGLLVNKNVDLLLELSKTAFPNADGLQLIVSLLLAAQSMIAFTGVIVGLTSFLAIRAAHRAILHLNAVAHSDTCFPFLPTSGTGAPGGPCRPTEFLFPKLAGGGARQNVEDAQLYYSGLPKLLTLFWALLFVVSLGVLFWSRLPPAYFFNHFKPAAVQSSPVQTNAAVPCCTPLPITPCQSTPDLRKNGHAQKTVQRDRLK